MRCLLGGGACERALEGLDMEDDLAPAELPHVVHAQEGELVAIDVDGAPFALRPLVDHVLHELASLGPVPFEL